MPLALLALFLVVTAVLLVRASNRERRDYRRFKRLTTTRERQLVLGKWLRESFLVFGSLAVAVLLASWQFIGPASASALAWGPIAWLRDGVNVWVEAGVATVFLVVLLLPLALLRKQVGDVPAVGDIGALLPRTRGEVKYGIGLSLNAGLVEELLFRLGMPALLFGITGNGPVAFGLAALLFGFLHIYQKALGVIVATLLGLVFTLIYLLTGSIWIVMIVHALIDLRSLVLIPLVIGRVWKVSTP